MSVELTDFDVINGIFTLVFVIISIVIGLRVIQRYLELRRIELLTFGLTWIFVTSAWWGSTLNFINILITDSVLDDGLFLFMSNMFLPLALICWMFSLTHIFYPDKEKQILVLFVAISLIYDIILIAFLLIDINLVGYVEGPFNSQPTMFVLIFQIFALLICVGGGIIFSKKSMEQNNPAVRWKGLFLFLGFVLFAIGGLSDALFPATLSTLVITRLILIVSGIFYYFGFFLPQKLANALIKQSN